MFITQILCCFSCLLCAAFGVIKNNNNNNNVRQKADEESTARDQNINHTCSRYLYCVLYRIVIKVHKASWPRRRNLCSVYTQTVKTDHVIWYDTIEEFNVDSKAEYTA